MIARDMDPALREQIERAMADPERCMPSERVALEAQGFVAQERPNFAVCEIWSDRKTTEISERVEPGEGVGGVSGSKGTVQRAILHVETDLPADDTFEFAEALPINECFETIQGEGFHVGKPACFIRLQGCPVGCSFCDTKHSWFVDPAKQVDAADLIALKRDSDDTWALADVETLIDWVSRCRARHVVLTGGEPCLYDLRPLSEALIDRGCSVQVETSGTHEVQISSRAWVTLAPKIDMPGGFAVRADAMSRADEIKMPVGKQDDLERLFALLDEHWHRPEIPIFLAPLSLSKKATELCVQACIANNFRLSLQTHQMIGVR